MTQETIKVYNTLMNGGEPNEELLSPVWKKWAKTLVKERMEELTMTDAFNSVADFIVYLALTKQFNEVQKSTPRAKEAILEHSPVLNNTFLKPIAKRAFFPS